MCERLIPQSLTYIETYIYTYWITVVENRVTHMQVRSNTIHIRLLFLRLWHTHTHTQTDTESRMHAHTHTHTHSPTVYQAVTQTQSRTHARTHTHTHLLSLRLWHSHARTHSPTVSGCDTDTQSRTHARTHSPTVSGCGTSTRISQQVLLSVPLLIVSLSDSVSLMAVKFFYEVGEFVEVDVSYGYVFMTVKEKVRLGLDLSCLTVNTHSLLSG